MRVTATQTVRASIRQVYHVLVARADGVQRDAEQLGEMVDLARRRRRRRDETQHAAARGAG